MRRSITILLLLLTAVASGAAQVKYSVYSNDRFFFSIEYPSSELKMQDPPANNDGRTFLSKDGSVEMRAYASHNALSNSVQAQLAEDVKAFGGSVTYKRLLKDAYVFSGTAGDKIYYQKTLYKGSGGSDVFYTFTISYPRGQKARFDPIVKRIAASFRFDPAADV